MRENPKAPRRATARHAFDAVGDRLQVDPALLAYIFSECLEEVLAEAKAASSCTLRGLGKFRTTSVSELSAEGQGFCDITVFERTKHPVKNTAFAALRLAKRMSSPGE